MVEVDLIIVTIGGSKRSKSILPQLVILYSRYCSLPSLAFGRKWKRFATFTCVKWIAFKIIYSRENGLGWSIFLGRNKARSN